MWGFLFLLPVLERGEVGVRFKQADKVSCIVITHLGGDLGNAQIGGAEQLFCFGYPQMIAVFMNGVAGTGFEQTT